MTNNTNPAASTVRIALPRAPLAILLCLWAWILPIDCAIKVLSCSFQRSWWWFTSSLVLSAVAWLVWAWLRGVASFADTDPGHKAAALSRFAGLIALGMTCGFLADLHGICPPGARPLGRFEPLIIAIVLFGLGHVAYIWACLNVSRRLGISSRPRARTLLIVLPLLWMTGGVVLWYALAADCQASADCCLCHFPLAAACLIYTLVLSTMTGVMTALAVLDRRFLPLGLGAVFFLVSDCLLASRLFMGNPFFIGDACWIVYGTGQMLIVFGAASVVGREMNIPQSGNLTHTLGPL